ncbi:MAG: HupE/UreJ family protein [Phycisphaerales bacterium]|nr:HupE/UreJ family protein [Phycisphaerales bacterium]
MIRRRNLPIALLALPAFAAPAQAHLVTTDLGPFYDGALHPVLAPLDALPIIALAALAGLAGAKHGRASFAALLTGWAVGAALAYTLRTPLFSPPLVTPIALLVLGIAAAANVKPPLALLASIAGLLGLFRGAATGADAASSDLPWLVVLGSTFGVLVLGVFTHAGAYRLSESKGRIAVRVAASWIAAIGLLLIGWHFKGLSTA